MSTSVREASDLATPGLHVSGYSRDVKFDDAALREALTTIHGAALTPAQAAAIVDVARFAASVDGRMDLKEMATVARLAKIVYAMSGQAEPSVPSTPVTEHWLADLDKKLTTVSVRELAFASAYVIVLADGKVVAEEVEFGGKLSRELGISPTRAKDLTNIVDTALKG
jgi:tellurite resistance protein